MLFSKRARKESCTLMFHRIDFTCMMLLLVSVEYKFRECGSKLFQCMGKFLEKLYASKLAMNAVFTTIFFRYFTSSFFCVLCMCQCYATRGNASECLKSTSQSHKNNLCDATMGSHVFYGLWNPPTWQPVTLTDGDNET